MTAKTRTAMADVERQPGKPPILRAEAAGDASRWAAEHGEALRAFVAEHGALLVRGLGLRDADGIAAVFRQLGTLMTERESFAARRLYSPGVYSASKWPPNQAMCLHHELSYAQDAPSLMLFACLVPSPVGGATPTADSTAVLGALPDDLVGRFEREGWLLIRNYNEEVGASFAEAFGVEDRGAVEKYCRAHSIEYEWREGGGLRTRQRRKAVVRHPVTGRRCWFNQAAFLNEWTMAPEVREYLVELYGEEGLPFNTRFGNGEPIGAEIVQAVNEAYERNAVRERWLTGDVLLVDNIRTAHGREPFEGAREVLVGLADPVRMT